MIKFVFLCFWYLLPAALGNHAASCGNRLWLPKIFKIGLAKIAIPVDSGIRWHGKEIFGRNKTWRGLLVGIATGIFTAGIQAFLFFNMNFFKTNTFIDYEKINFVILGALMGGGALTGDLAKSFIKRRLDISPGKPWFPWDQLDWIAGAMLFSSITYVPSIKIALVTAVLYVGIHLCSDRIVCRMGIKKREEIN
ncbi:MAG: CDP-archaeol synthase [Candidatus Omnitrophica bacterium]|nr:CDP-archaeol synthase [Candidatus Omnitrophota bacterium]